MRRITLTLFALVLSAMACTALAQINACTFEEVSIYRMPADISLKDGLLQLRESVPVQGDILKPGDFIAFRMPGLQAFLRENNINLLQTSLVIDDIVLTELHAYPMLSDSGLIFFKFDLHKVDIEKRKLLYQLPNHPTSVAPIESGCLSLFAEIRFPILAIR